MQQFRKTFQSLRGAHPARAFQESKVPEGLLYVLTEEDDAAVLWNSCKTGHCRAATSARVSSLYGSADTRLFALLRIEPAQ
jgi:hypothetical protein